MRRYLAHFLAVVLVLAMAAPAVQAQQAQKAMPKGIVTPKAAEAKNSKELSLTSKVKTMVPGQSQFKHHKITAPGQKGKKQYAPLNAGGFPSFFANITYNDDWTSGSEAAIYSISTTSPAVVERVSDEAIGNINLNMGGAATETQIVGTYYFEFWGTAFVYVYTYDRETYQQVGESMAGDLTACALDMTYDPVTKNVYGIFYNETASGLNFGIFNPEQGNSTAIAPLQATYTRIAAAKDGKLYVMDDDGNIGTINKQTGAITSLGNFGVTSDYPCSAAIDPRSGLIYYATCPETDNSELYAIDPATPTQANLVYEFPSNVQYSCAYFPVLKAEDGAPAEPTINSLAFEGTSLRGKINFSMPAEHYDGSAPAAGETLRYEILANDKVIAQGGNVQYGHSYSLNISVEAADLYTFKVIVYNEVGASPAAEEVLYVGADSPAAVQNVVAAFADEEMTITWDAVTAGAHNGVIGSISYSVYNAETGKLIAEAITGTSLRFGMIEPEEYTSFTYKVVAVSDGLESEAGISNTITLGAITPPYANALTSIDELAGWRVIDNNRDGKTWQVSDNGLVISYNSSKAADDYAVAPPIRVKKGNAYTVSVAAAGKNKLYTESFEVVALTSPTSVAGAQTVIAKTDITSVEFATYESVFLPTEDAVVYFAIHGISKADQYSLYVNNFSVGAALKAAAPAAATELVVTPDFNGTAKATVSFVVPDKAINGTALSSIDKIEVLVGDKVKHTARKTVPGEAMSVEVETDATGTLDFSVVAYNAAGTGVAATATAFVGVPLPGAPTGATVEEVSEGVVTIKWEAPAEDANGNAMNPAFLTYTIVDAYSGDIVAEDVVGTEYANFEAAKAGEQDFVCYAVFAMTSAGLSEGYAVTNDLVVGTPYALPFSETAADGKLHYNWIYARSSSFIELGLADDSMYNITSRNNDNGFFLISSSYAKENLTLVSGKIAITGDEPYLTFYTYCFGASDQNTFSADVVCDGDTTTVYTAVLGEGNEGNWNRHSVDLKAFAGKTVQLHLVGAIVNNGNILFDDITIGAPVKYDLYAKSISAPGSLAPNSEFDINYEIQNLGLEAATGYSVQIYADGDLLETITDLPEIKPGETYSGSLTHKPYSLFETGTYQFSFVVAYAQDQETDNNGSATVAVKVANSNFPVTEISGEVNEKTVTLSWENPLIDTSASTVTDDFDSADYPAFTTTSFGDWTLVNKNENATWGINGTTFPGSETAFGWILFDAEAVGVGEEHYLYGYDSPCYMAAFSHQEGANDAWLISPQLQGMAQTITFMAKCATTQYGNETMECLYSTTDANTESFTKAEITGYNEATGVTEDWVEYSFSVPTGTKYFAIRSTATDCFILMVDNITYLGAPAFATLEHVGFDVYRNGEKLNEETLLGTSYTDTVEDYGTYTYNVVCVYNEGVSAPSNSFVADIKDTGIADATSASAISVEGNTIVVTGATSVVIAAADGKVVYTAAGNDNCRATVAAGVYVVKTNDATAKVIVK